MVARTYQGHLLELYQHAWSALRQDPDFRTHWAFVEARRRLTEWVKGNGPIEDWANLKRYELGRFGHVVERPLLERIHL